MISDDQFAPRDQTPDRSIPRFHMRPVEMYFRSEQEGRPIFEDQEFVEIITPGNARSIACEPVNPGHKLRWPLQYDTFKRGLEEASVGTPLEQVAFLSPSQVLNFKALHIRTVEELSGVTDSALQAMGPGSRDLRAKAQRYLDGAVASAATTAAEARASRAEDENARLLAQVTELAGRLETLENKRGKRRPEPEED